MYDKAKLKSKELRQLLRARQTRAEAMLWVELRKLRKQYGIVFRRQHSFEWFVVDFYYPSKKLVIELDGSIHGHEEVWMYDEARQKIIEEEHGVSFIRFTNQEIYNDIHSVLKKIIQNCF